MIIDNQLNNVQGSDVRVTIEFGEKREMKTIVYLLKNLQLELSAEPETETIEGKIHYKLSSERRISIRGILKEDS